MTVFTLAPRPAAGTKGISAIATTNCFRVSIVRRLAFHHYHAIKTLSGNNDIKSVTRRRDIITSLYVREHPSVFQPGQVAFDGKAGLYTSKDLGPDRDLHFELSESHAGMKCGTVRVQLQKVGFISDSDFEALQNWQHQPETVLTTRQILNLLLQNSTPSGFRKVVTKNAMFSMSDKRVLGMGLLFVRGCFASVRLAREHLLLNVDICSAIMYESGLLHNVATALLGLSDCRALRDMANVQKLLSLLKKVRVQQVNAGKIGRVRTVKDIVANAGSQVFCLPDESSTTVADYFLRSHNYKLQYPYLPGIRVIKKGRLNENTDRVDIIPFELLKVIEGQFYRRKLNEQMRQVIHSGSAIKPEARRKKILGYLEAFTPAALDSAGLHVDRDLVSIRGRVLPPPRVTFRNRIEQKPEDGIFRLSRRYPTPFYQPCTIRSWAVLCYERSCKTVFVMEILTHLCDCLNFHGVNTKELKAKAEIVTNMENPQGNKQQHLERLMADLRRVDGNLSDPNGVLILVILPGGGKSFLYEEIKRIGDTEAGKGLITQCLAWDMLSSFRDADSSRADQYLSNIALKINVKMGGINFVPKGEGLEWISNPKTATMVIGLDVSHPGPGIFRPSMAGMVYSVDQFASKYFPMCTGQPPRVEAIQDLQEMIKLALLRFQHHVRRTYSIDLLPSRLLVYRDGLSDGELVNVGEAEIEAIRGGIKAAWNEAKNTKKTPADKVTITYVVVGKRHHIRFFPEGGQGDRSGNCRSGFVTDDTRITSPHVYDFFLLSHAGLLGTSRPAHYMVLKDENSLTADGLQSITFGLCHAFARATRAVSIPAPVYYAHLVCKRANIHIEFKDSQSLPSSTCHGDFEYTPDDWRFYGINRTQSKLMYFA